MGTGPQSRTASRWPPDGVPSPRFTGPRPLTKKIGTPPDEDGDEPPGALTMAQYQPVFYRDEPGAAAAWQEALAYLMRSLLLKWFESSWYVALQTVRRMRRHAATRIRYLEVEGGGQPFPEDEEALNEIEAAAAELAEEPDDWAEPEMFRPDVLTDLQRNVDVLDELVEQIAALDGQPDPKLEALREVMATTDSQKVVVFTSFRDTAQYLRRAFEQDPELIAGREWAAVVGADASETDRAMAIDCLCPDFAVVPGAAASEHGEIDVLLSTDVLSEGQNLQQAQAVLSYDMPWNPQRVVQRNGRVIRLRSPHEAPLHVAASRRRTGRAPRPRGAPAGQNPGRQRLDGHGEACPCHGDERRAHLRGYA